MITAATKGQMMRGHGDKGWAGQRSAAALAHVPAQHISYVMEHIRLA
jgi:hypothetical protein